MVKTRMSQDPLAELIWTKYHTWFQRRTRDAAVADDLCQKLWLKVSTWLVNRASNDNAVALDPLSAGNKVLGVAAKHVLYGWHRSQPANPAESFDETTTKVARNHRPLAEQLMWRRLVRAEIARLLENDEQRHLLASLDDDTATVAEQLGMTPALVSTHRHRLRRRLSQDSRLLQLWQDLRCA